MKNLEPKILMMLESRNEEIATLGATIVLGMGKEWIEQHIPHLWRGARSFYVPHIETSITNVRIVAGDISLVFNYGGLWWIEDKNIKQHPTQKVIRI